MENVVPANDELNEFIEFLYGGLEGYVYVAAKDPNNPDPKTNWIQDFFSYPSDVGRLASLVKKASASHEIYMAPALFKDNKSAGKDNVKVTNVVWAEFDGNAPEEWLGVSEPSLVVQSSGPQNLHCYWKLSEPLYDTQIIDATNRAIAYGLSADTTGWDANQILRPPLTLNHKPERAGSDGGPPLVRLISNAHTAYDIDVFGSLPAPPKHDDSPWELESLPNPQHVLLKYEFTPDMVLLLDKKEADLQGKRSTALMNLAFGLCQMGMTDTEVFVMLRLADDSWGKFKGRKDRNKRLAQIVSFARNKYPSLSEDQDPDEPFTYVMDYMTLLETEVEIEWLIEPMLMTAGAMLMVGPSGVGKTQWTLQALTHLALGKDWLHYKIPKAKKVAFFSLEMDLGSLKLFLKDMAAALTDEEKERLRTNFIVVPHGEPWPLNIPEGQKHMLDIIEQIGAEVVSVDSIGSSIKGNISSDDDVLPLLAFHDRLRKKYGCALWNIHHMRKNSQNGGHASTQDDVYGNQFIFNRATSCYGMLRSKGGSLRLKNLKQRLAPQEEDFFVKRIDHLNFAPHVKEVDESIDTMLHSYVKPEEDKGPQPQAGGFDL